MNFQGFIMWCTNQKYDVSLSRIFNDMLTLHQLQWLTNWFYFSPISWPWYMYRARHSPNYEWYISMDHLERVWHASRERLPLRTPGPLWGLTYNPIVETSLPDLAVSVFDFSPWIPLSFFSIKLLLTEIGQLGLFHLILLEHKGFLSW